VTSAHSASHLKTTTQASCWEFQPFGLWVRHRLTADQSTQEAPWGDCFCRAFHGPSFAEYPPTF